MGKPRIVRARVVGDNIDTDTIIASHRKRDSPDANVLRRYLFEHLRPDYIATVEPGDMLVAGKNFGCGSAMEVAATVIAASGLTPMIAASYARTFYRNAINNGLHLSHADTTTVTDCAYYEYHAAPRWVLRPLDGRGDDIQLRPVTGLASDIVAAGGLIPYVNSGRSLTAHLHEP